MLSLPNYLLRYYYNKGYHENCCHAKSSMHGNQKKRVSVFVYYFRRTLIGTRQDFQSHLTIESIFNSN